MSIQQYKCKDITVSAFSFEHAFYLIKAKVIEEHEGDPPFDDGGPIKIDREDGEFEHIRGYADILSKERHVPQLAKNSILLQKSTKIQNKLLFLNLESDNR